MASSSSAVPTERVVAAPSVTASASLGLLGVLPVPAGARAWPTNTNRLMSLVSFVQASYIKSAWGQEEALYARRGFVAAVERGWTNADGSEQFIALVRLATPAGAASALDEQISDWKDQPGVTAVADPGAGAAGFSDPTLDSQGNAHVNFFFAVGNTVVRVIEYTAATPDPAAAKTLVEEQYQRLKNGS